jgi:pyruvate-ferredoxin/flavodoxin oxidoreductase
VLLLNAPYPPDKVWDHLPRVVQETDHRRSKLKVLRDRRYKVAREQGMGRTHQHRHADLLLRHQRRAPARGGHRRIKESIKKTYGKRGEAVVRKNYAAVDATRWPISSR